MSEVLSQGEERFRQKEHCTQRFQVSELLLYLRTRRRVLQSPGEDLGFLSEEKGLWRNLPRADVTQLKLLRSKAEHRERSE